MTRTILGVSNVSFGLPPAGREVLNSVFLYHCTRAGLDAAIVNTQRLARYAEIPDEERRLAESLLFLEPGAVADSEAAVAAFAEHFRGRKVGEGGAPRADLPLPERLARAVVEGSKEGLAKDLDEALADPTWPTPLEIVNGPLMNGMSEVGRLFNDNQLIVAEVLQSAEVMKAAVSHLEPHMEKADSRSRGKLMLATVKGDVHDIGKNLVDIVVSNNGFEVVNLGIKVPSEVLIQAVQEHQPDVLGLSGLLVKSAQQMVLTAGDLAAAGIDLPLVVGGAALTRRFAHKKIVPAYSGLCTYARDAMHGLELIDRLTDPNRRPDLELEVAELVREDTERAEPVRLGVGEVTERRSTRVRADLPVPSPPDLERHVENLDLDEVWSLVNPQMLYGKHLGLRGSVRALRAKHDPKLADLERMVSDLQTEGRRGGLAARAVWRFFPARSAGNRLSLFDPRSGDPVAVWELPRQRGRDGLCISDYVLENDHVALFVTTAGQGVRAAVEGWKEAGEYLRSHAYAALALETAEAAAELVHAKLRNEWGFADSPELTRQDIFSARYRGNRFSFGYPACPDLEGQRALFAALDPSEIGVELTEGDMMDPEASVSALVFHHPDARYFGV